MSVDSLEELFVTKPILPGLDVIAQHLQDTWQSGILTNGGPKCRELESRLKTFLSCNNIAVFNNGTNALIAIIQALGLRGDVIVTPFTFAATVHALHYANIKPVFVDVDPITMTLDPSKIEEAITAETTGIMAVHVYGTPCDVVGIGNIAKQRGLKVVYDSAHAFNTRIDQGPLSDFGDASVLSFHATKLFHSIEGGAVIVKDEALLERLTAIRNFGIRDEENVPAIGFNGKLNELQAAVGLSVLDLVDNERVNRSKIAAVYAERLSAIPEIRLPHKYMLNRDSYQYYCIVVDQEGRIPRNELYVRLKKYGINARKYFFPLCSNFPAYRDLPSASIDRLPVANRLSNEVLCLPFYGQLGASGAHRVADAITAIFND